MTTGPTAAEWLAAHPATTADEGLAFYDSLPPVTVAEMLGRWRGAAWPSGHPWDGLLEAYGWYGKEFLDAERVHPLLFRGRGGRIVAIDPRWMPVGAMVRVRWTPPAFVFALVRGLLVTTAPAARLRIVEDRGRPTAGMIYDRLPIVDTFRAVDADTRLGRMDLRGMPAPFLFVLRRDG